MKWNVLAASALFLQLAGISLSGCNGTSSGAAASAAPIGQIATRVADRVKECGLIVVECSVQGHLTRGIVDTGSVITVVNTDLDSNIPPGNRYKKTLKLPDAAAEVTIQDGVRVTVGRFDERIVSVAVMDLSSFEQGLGFEIGLFIGRDLLASHQLILDPLSEPLPQMMPEEYARWPMKKILFTSASRVPTVEIDVPILGVQEFGVDTGFNRVMTIKKPLADKLLHMGLATHSREASGTNAGGHGSDRSNIIIRELTFMGVPFTNVEATVKTYNSVGMELVRRFELAFDFPQGVYYHMDKSKVSRLPFFINTSGVAFIFESQDSVAILGVEKNSPGEKMGLKVGDHLVSLDGRSCSELTRQRIDHIISQVGKTIHVSMKRDEIPYEVDIELNYPVEYPPKWKPLPDADGAFLDFLNRGEVTNSKD